MEEIKRPETTKDTPIEEVKRIHQRIWDYVIKYGEKPETSYPSSCVACAYTRIHDDAGSCNRCPILWPKFNARRCCINNGSGLYDIYLKLLCYKHPIRDRIKMRILAKQIRDLPWKFETKKE